MSNTVELTEKKNANAIPTELGTEKIWKLLKSYALPAIIAMTASSLYNMVDSIFVGHGVGPMAISGLAVTFPLMNLSTAFGTLVGVGGSTLLSIMLGQKNYVGARKILNNVLMLNIIIGVIFGAATLSFLDPILYFFGASDNTIAYARDYMTIILLGNAITHVYFGLNNSMRATGSPKKAMGLTIFTVLFNTILDPVMIFTLDMGIKGAAWATVIAQTLAMIVVIFHFSRKDKEIRFEKNILRMDWRIAKDLLAIGFGPFLMNAASCIVALFINQQMGRYAGDLGIGAYGICNRITFMFVMICMGLNQGMQPIAGYNYGARQYSRVKEVYLKTALLATIVSLLCFVVCIFFPQAACSIFTKDEQLLALASKGLRIMNIVFPVVGFQMVGTNLFQCLGMVRKSIFLSLSRQLLCLVPAIYILPMFFGETGVWISFPISDLIASILTIILLGRLFSRFNRIKDGESSETLEK